MHMYALISAVLAALCCIHFAFAGPDGIDCQCICYELDGNGKYTEIGGGSIHLNLTVCDDKKCLSGCNTQYKFCEQSNGEMHAICSLS